ncbi:hypothetical protein [Micromonospora ureilytica]|uniref:hypothetical protein n=1 Tax=Micromonospora ureilytica TaxID=709868 RepID=UPI002E0F7133|nr:hypothetical protein OHB55_08180 [Micromonospora ureilytica]
MEAFTADSGQDPVEAFGPVETYSDSIAAELRDAPPKQRRARVLLWGYPPAVGSLVLVDGLWGVLRGDRAEITVGKAMFVVLLPLAVLLLVAASTHAGRWAYVAAASIGVASVALLWAGDGLLLLRYPAWIGLGCGAVLLVTSLALVTKAHRDPVIDPRTGQDRHPMTVRLAVLAGGPMALMLILLVVVALLAD